MEARALDNPGTVQAFVESIPRCEEKLADYTQDGNALIFAGIDAFLDKAAAGLL
jgi:hypothetical protein